MHLITITKGELAPLVLSRTHPGEMNAATRWMYLWEDNLGLDILLERGHNALKKALDRGCSTAQEHTLALDELKVEMPMPFDSYAWEHYRGSLEPKSQQYLAADKNFNLARLRQYFFSLQSSKTHRHRLHLRPSARGCVLWLTFPLCRKLMCQKMPQGKEALYPSDEALLSSTDK